MKEADKALARRALKQNRLTIDQVEQVRAEVDRTGRSFREICVGRGLLSAADFPDSSSKSIPPVYFVMLACSLIIFGGLLFSSWYQLHERSKKDDDLAVATT